MGYSWELEEYIKSRLVLDVNIPDNFVVQTAKITLEHSPINWDYTENNATKNVWGYSRNIKLYKVTNLNSVMHATAFGGEMGESHLDNSIEIANAFGSNGFTASTPTGSNVKLDVVESTNIVNYLNARRTVLVIQTSNNAPAAGTALSPNISGYQQTGIVKAILNIIGYMK